MESLAILRQQPCSTAVLSRNETGTCAILGKRQGHEAAPDMARCASLVDIFYYYTELHRIRHVVANAYVASGMGIASSRGQYLLAWRLRSLPQARTRR